MFAAGAPESRGAVLTPVRSPTDASQRAQALQGSRLLCNNQYRYDTTRFQSTPITMYVNSDINHFEAMKTGPMKRDAYGDDGPVYKRQRQHDDEVTFLIPSKMAGSIIGKGGSNISKLRNEYKASITVPDCPGPERVLSISASDIDTILEIVKDILPNLAEGGPKGGGNEDLDVRLLIHQSRAGCVIGKAGAKIKELREKTGARLKIFSSTAPQSTERVVQLMGSKEAVAAGVREVLELIRQVPIKGAVQNYDPHNYDDYYADEYGGFGGGAGGARARAAAGAGPAARAPRPDARRARRRRAPRRPAPELAGAIIGKAGTRIRKIRAESGAGIEIAEPLPGSSDRIITITGSPQCIQMAQYLLQQSVHESNPNLGRGNF
ncbi:unnamed protein product [Parnassius apollo]|uniref:(apollo) hypothetical protein n=1 Tax=Parnassius apollo TaxID=110799 RepID=A0A8S3Y103_PARAO|nr:unnamed protein product [Parnassius apollo]